MKYSFGSCPTCGGGGLNLPPIKITPIINSKPSNYCSKCGQSLLRKCSSCNGTGKKRLFVTSVFGKDRYCTECGRELNPPNDECMNCNGTGEIYDGYHFCL